MAKLYLMRVSDCDDKESVDEALALGVEIKIIDEKIFVVLENPSNEQLLDETLDPHNSSMCFFEKVYPPEFTLKASYYEEVIFFGEEVSRDFYDYFHQNGDGNFLPITGFWILEGKKIFPGYELDCLIASSRRGEKTGLKHVFSVSGVFSQKDKEFMENLGMQFPEPLFTFEIEVKEE